MNSTINVTMLMVDQHSHIINFGGGVSESGGYPIEYQYIMWLLNIEQ